MERNLQRLDEALEKAVNFYFEICHSDEAMVFLETVYDNLYKVVGIEPNLNLDQPYTDSPLYQRRLISESCTIIMSLDDTQIKLVTDELEQIVLAIRELAGYETSENEDSALEQTDPDEDWIVEEDSSENEPEYIDGESD